MGFTTVAKVSCPSCGARIEIERSCDHATCEYCGTTSIVSRRGEAPSGPARTAAPQIQIASARQARLLMLFIVGFVVLTVGGAVVRILIAVADVTEKLGGAMDVLKGVTG